MESPPVSPGTPASYGRACTNCARAKAKCVYRSDGVSCKRCDRLDKECQRPIRARRRNVRSSVESGNTRLEDKLEDLVSLLRSQATTRSADTVPLPSSNVPPSDLVTRNVRSPDPPSETVYLNAPTASYVISDSSPENEISPHVAEEYLEVFRTCMLSFFPFVYIPHTTTAANLRRQRPFLWLCIMCTTTKSIAQRGVISNQIKHIISEQIVREGERSIDLLLGLICYIGWAHYNAKHIQNLSLWSNLANVQVFDLGLNKPPPARATVHQTRSVWGGPAKPTSGVCHDRTLEERRAVLGAFLITSTVSTMQKKIDPLRWTPHMESSVRILNEQSEWQGDRILAAQVRCHLLIRQISHFRSNYEEACDADTSRSPPSYYAKALQSQLLELKRSLPSELAHVGTQLAEARQTTVIGLANILAAAVQFFLHSTELCINEGALNQALITSGITDWQVLEGLLFCLNAIDAWCTVFFAMPLTVDVGITQAIYMQLSHSLITLFELTKHQEMSWSRDVVKKTINVFDVLDRLANRMEQVPAIAGVIDNGVPDENIFFRSCRNLRALKTSWEAEEAELQMSRLSNQGQYSSQTASDDLALNLVSDQWPMDIFGAWDT